MVGGMRSIGRGNVRRSWLVVIRGGWNRSSSVVYSLVMPLDST